MASYDYDVIVIGSGTSGSIAAQHLARAGKNVAVIEDQRPGGSSALRGSLPRAALLRTARLYEDVRAATPSGLRGSTVSLNFPSLKAWKNHVTFSTGASQLTNIYQSLGINLIRGRAFFLNPHTVSIGAARFSAEKFLIATGSQLVPPHIPGMSNQNTTLADNALDINRPPRHLAILGADEVGLELATLFASFGSRVEVFSEDDIFLPEFEEAAAELIAQRFAKHYGMKLWLNSKIQRLETLGVKRKIHFDTTEGRQTNIFDEVIIAGNRTSNIDIGLENAGVSVIDGKIATDDKLKTSVEHIFATGSCTTAKPSANLSLYQSQIVAHNLQNTKRPVQLSANANVQHIMTYPEVASAGLLTTELEQQNIPYRTVRVSLDLVAKSQIEVAPSGFVQISASKKTDVILAATIVSPNAGELINELSMAITNQLNVRQVSDSIRVFPTYGEAIRIACLKLAKS